MDSLHDVDVVLRRYGFFGLEPAAEGRLVDASWSLRLDQIDDSTTLLRGAATENFAPLDLDFRVEPGRQLLWHARRGWFGRRHLVYHALLPHLSFAGPGLHPLWVTRDGRAVLAWRELGGRREILLGIPVVDDMVRHTQGEPTAEQSHNKARWGFGHERPNYLYEEQLLPHYATTPWADHLGFTLVEMLAELTGIPLIAPLPHGAHGAVMLTGDDDEAYLEKYADQLRCLGDFPMTYFLLPTTRHTQATLAQLPANVELGVHVNALDTPEPYETCCLDQTRLIADMTGRPMRTVRNHGFLSRGYNGHLNAWENAGLGLDVNLPGLDGTALTGSFLPFRVRRRDGSWSAHHSLLTTFGDGMRYVKNYSQTQACRRIRQLHKQISVAHPGILVFNFHPQNFADTDRMHVEVMRLARRPGWTALGAHSFLDWLEARENLRLHRTPTGSWHITSPRPLDGLTLISPSSTRLSA